ncbi:membrane protein [Terrihabitans soli]|uniref:Membrane protein n=1 Tax=Terrihabitans soli TaxID=708113 RepID=A0A6S6QK41_9HYPH|nr:tripartite tricarboxylate transporter TctB family protein [Terrihabitans soli]BCJ89606.1 membrane protein [Terrihabitans soli]
MGKTLAVVCAVLAAVYLILSSMIPVRLGEDPVGPRMYPLLLGGGMVIIALLLWLEARGALAPVSEPQAPADPDLSRRQRRGVFGAGAAALFYAVAMESVGYLAATFLLMFGLLSAFNRGKHPMNIAIAAGTSAVLYYGLKKGLGVALPSGLFGFLG